MQAAVRSNLPSVLEPAQCTLEMWRPRQDGDRQLVWNLTQLCDAKQEQYNTSEWTKSTSLSEAVHVPGLWDIMHSTDLEWFVICFLIYTVYYLYKKGRR